jgi:hypothetical protein
MAQVVEHLPINRKARVQNPSTAIYLKDSCTTIYMNERSYYLSRYNSYVKAALGNQDQSSIQYLINSNY